MNGYYLILDVQKVSDFFGFDDVMRNEFTSQDNFFDLSLELQHT